MDQQFRPNRWIAAVVVAAVAVAAVVAGAVAYNLGVARGLALGGQAPVAVAPGMVYPYYGWYHPWGFGFGFFTPFLFLAFWFLIFRVLFWGGRWRRHRYYVGHGDMPRAFDEWHRRAHEDMKTAPPAPNV